MTPQEFSQKIKEKYPQYQNIDDMELTNKIISKYPQYKNEVEMKNPEPKKSLFQKAGEYLAPVGKTIGEAAIAGEGIGSKVIRDIVNIPSLGGASRGRQEFKEARESQQGLDDMNQKLADMIIDKKAKGENTQRLEKMYQSNTGRIFKPEEIAPSMEKTLKQHIGDAGITALNTLMGGTYQGAAQATGIGGIASRILISTGRGAAMGASQAASQDLLQKDITKKAATGGAISFAFSSAFEALRAMTPALIDRMKNRPAILAERGIAVDKNTLAERIYWDNEPIGNEILRGGYNGNINEVVRQAEANQKAAGQALGSLLEAHNDKVINGAEIKKNMAQIITNEYPDQFHKILSVELDKIPDSLNPNQANELKKEFAEKVYKSGFKEKIIQSVLPEKKEFLKNLASSLRESIDEITGDEAIKEMNKKWAEAFRIRGFSAELAGKIRAGSGGEVSLWNAITKLYNKTLNSTTMKLWEAENLPYEKAVAGLQQIKKLGGLRYIIENIITREGSK